MNLSDKNDMYASMEKKILYKNNVIFHKLKALLSLSLSMLSHPLTEENARSRLRAPHKLDQ